MRENGCIIHSSILPLEKRIGFTSENLVLRIVEDGYSALGLLIQIYSCSCILFLVIAVDLKLFMSSYAPYGEAKINSKHIGAAREIVIGCCSNGVGVAPLK